MQQKQFLSFLPLEFVPFHFIHLTLNNLLSHLTTILMSPVAWL